MTKQTEQTSTAVALIEQGTRQGVALPVSAAERGIDPIHWHAVKNGIFNGASDNMVVLALDYCKARKLDILKKPIHIVTTWDSKQKKNVETIWEGIASVRITAERTGQYIGKDETKFGPDIEKSIGGVNMIFPEWAQITIQKEVKGKDRLFAGPRVYWMESYSSIQSGAPNMMWKKRPRGQLEKCAEAAALRVAFPDNISAEPTFEEMEGQTIDNQTGQAVDKTETTGPKKSVNNLDDFATDKEPDKPDAIDAVFEEMPAPETDKPAPETDKKPDVF